MKRSKPGPQPDTASEHLPPVVQHYRSKKSYGFIPDPILKKIYLLVNWPSVPERRLLDVTDYLKDLTLPLAEQPVQDPSGSVQYSKNKLLERGVAYQAMLHRLVNIRIVDNSIFSKLVHILHKSLWIVGENISCLLPQNLGNLEF